MQLNTRSMIARVCLLVQNHRREWNTQSTFIADIDSHLKRSAHIAEVGNIGSLRRLL